MKTNPKILNPAEMDGRIKYSPGEYIKIIDGKYKGHYGFVCPGSYPLHKKIWLTTYDDLITIEEDKHMETISEAEYTVARIMML